MVALSCCLWTLKTFARWQLRTAYSGSRLAVFYHMDACAWGHGHGGHLCVPKANALQLDKRGSSWRLAPTCGWPLLLFLTVTRDARRFAYAFELSTCLQCDDNRADPVRRARDDATRADGDGRRLPGVLHSIGI